MPQDRWVALAEVARPHGVRGELRLRSFNPESEVIARVSEFLLRLPDGAERRVAVESQRGTASNPIVKLRGIDDRDRAAELRGALVLIERAELPPPGEGEFYLVDVVGASVRDSERQVGKVVSIVNYPTADVLVVERDADGGAGRLEIPITDAFVDSVDLDCGEITLVEGALEQLG